MTDTILFLGSAKITAGQQTQLESYMKRANIPAWSVRWECNSTQGFGKLKGKKAWSADMTKRSEWLGRLGALIAHHKPGVIVINDALALEYITKKYRSLEKCRGGVYFINDIPAVVIDSLITTDGYNKLRAVPEAGFILLRDLEKVNRWYTRTMRQEPRFQWTIIEQFSTLTQFHADMVQNGVLIGCDIETAGHGNNCILTSIAYSIFANDRSIRTYVIPLIPKDENRIQGFTLEEIPELFSRIRHIHATNLVPFIFQNGSYDASHLIRWRLPVENWLFDTAIMFHSIWPELKKRIDFITSIACDRYRYWKDENKTEDKDDDQKSSIPGTPDAWFRYLRYNGFDTYYTLLCCVWLLPIITKSAWAGQNYTRKFRQAVGPALAMSMRGVRVNQNIQRAMADANLSASAHALGVLRKMVGQDDFNPAAPVQVAQMVYDVLRAQPLPMGKSKKALKVRSADEKALEVVRIQHPLISKYVKQIWAVNKPRNNASKYGPSQYIEGKGMRGLQLMHGRWMYKVNSEGTETGRYSSSASNFWLGTNIQNVPEDLREMVEPDEGYYLWKFDYSKADFWHTAFASEEPNMMRLLLDTDIDTHCYHASIFFSKPYEEVYAGYKNKEPWVVDSLRGIRQNAKRIAYGSNYLMAGYTLLLTMGLEAVRASAEFLNHDTRNWTIKDFTRFCQSRIDMYFDVLYPGLKPYLMRATNRAKNAGGMHTCTGGNTRTFFRDLVDGKEGQREFAAFIGQGGTAGMINLALDTIYYSGQDSHDCMALFMIHDDITGQVKKDKLHLLNDIMNSMQIENEVNGYKFIVPVEGYIGCGWGGRMIEITNIKELSNIDEANTKWFKKKGWDQRAFQ